MWEFYLAYCEAGFSTGYIDVVQLQMQRPAEVGAL
jgi:cyclopropane-fatty-acyl-phospholipid synthase